MHEILSKPHEEFNGKEIQSRYLYKYVAVYVDDHCPP